MPESTIDIQKSLFQVNSDLWEIVDSGSEASLRIINNKMIDHVGGKVALLEPKMGNFTMEAEMRFLGHHLADGRGGWFGFVLRAQDTENYELVWFMPNAGAEPQVAYLSVAHGVVPWWTEAYQNQVKGRINIPMGDWFRARVDVMEDGFTLEVEGVEIFEKKLTYYLSAGYQGFYVGTATDAAFRRVRLMEN